MYRLENLDQLLSLPNNVEKCTIKYQKVLESVYESKKRLECTNEFKVLHEFLIKKIKEGYQKDMIVEDIVLTKEDIEKLRNLLGKQ